MIVKDIKESGSNNVLMWAISNNANVGSDEALQSVINDELFYQVTLGDVNFFELFRLTQLYREKLRIIDELPADIPPTRELVNMFNGTYDSDNGEHVPLHELVTYAIQAFMNITTQMGVDDDIIYPGARQLFVPMICRRFDVQIPVGFIDVVMSMTSDEIGDIFNSNYPDTLSSIIDAEQHSLKTNLMMAFIRSTSPIKYSEKYDKYLSATKYFALNAHPSDKLYHAALLGAHKYNPISRGETRFNLFMPNMDVLGQTMKQLSRISGPMDVDFVVRMPIQYMQIIENTFSTDVLGVTYESSIQSIINDGIQFNDFTMPGIDPNTEDPDQIAKLDEYRNRISEYRIRISEANQLAVNAISILLHSDADIDPRSAIALLPSIYNTKAMFTIHTDRRSQYVGHRDPVIAEMFNTIFETAQQLVSNISNEK